MGTCLAYAGDQTGERAILAPSAADLKAERSQDAENRDLGGGAAICICDTDPRNQQTPGCSIPQASGDTHVGPPTNLAA